MLYQKKGCKKVGTIFNPNLEARVARGAVESNSGFLSSS